MKPLSKMLGLVQAARILSIASTMMAIMSPATLSGRPEPNKLLTESLRGSKDANGMACGVERQAVKTSTDKDAQKVDMVPIPTTVEDLNQIPAPTRAELDAKPDTRFKAELQTYTVVAYLDGFKKETDEDFHIGITDLRRPEFTMVAEMISDQCAPLSIRSLSAQLRNSWEKRFGKASSKFKKMGQHKIKIRITGIGFFDFIHGQTDVAKNGFELHRVIAWEEVFDEPAKPTGTGNNSSPVLLQAMSINEPSR